MSAPVDILLHDMAHGGEAVGRLEDGRAVFVAGALPGERVRVEIVHEKKRWARARLVEVLEPSADRVAPPCPHFEACGGCQWQHIALGRQRELKREVVRGLLVHLGGLTEPLVEPTLGVGPEDGFGYRNHVVFAIDPEGRTGYFRASSREIVPIERCPVLHPLLREWHETLPELPGGRRLELRVGTRTAQRLALLQGYVEAQALREAADRGVPLSRAGDGELSEMVGAERMRVSSKSFFQVNTDGAEKLVELVLGDLEPTEEDSVVDAYAGVGLFTVPLARRTAKVYAVEKNAAAVRDLRHHAEASKGKVHVIATDMESAFVQLPQRVPLVVADPPREGLGAVVAEGLAAMQPRRLVLVACDPAALARDVRTLGELGYRLERAQPVDLFPHTFHVEVVARFVRAD